MLRIQADRLPQMLYGLLLPPLKKKRHGKPVVASNVDGIPEVLVDNETGLLFEPGKAEDLANKIATLAQNQEMRERMGKARGIKVKEFTFDKIAEQTAKLYREILDSTLLERHSFTHGDK